MCNFIYPLSLLLTLVAVTFVHRNKIDVPRYDANGKRINLTSRMKKQTRRNVTSDDPNGHLNIQDDDSDSGESIDSDDEFEVDENGLPKRKSRASCCCCKSKARARRRSS